MGARTLGLDYHRRRRRVNDGGRVRSDGGKVRTEEGERIGVGGLTL